MKNLVFALRLSILACAALLAQPAFASAAHGWTYHVNGRYGYVNSQYANLCASVPWQSCSRPIVWLMYDGTAALGVLQSKRPALYRLIKPALDPSTDVGPETSVTLFGLVPSPTQYISDVDGMKSQQYLILEVPRSPWQWGPLPHHVRVLREFADGTHTVNRGPISANSLMMRAYDDVRSMALTLSQPTASDMAQLAAARQWGKDHPEPAHWWAYHVDGVYGFVKDPVAPTCTPDWKLCKKPITWFLYNGQKDDGENVFTLFHSPTQLAAGKQVASPMTFSVQPSANNATLSYLVTDGSEAAQNVSIDYRSDLWFALQDVARGQLQPSSVTVAEMNTLANQRQAFNHGRQAFMRRALEDYMNRQEIIVHTEP